MRLGKEICNLHGRRNQRQSNGAMLEMMTSKMTNDLNVLSSLMKNQVVSNLNKTLVVTIHRSRMRKKTLISARNQRNQTISLVVDVMAEAEGKSKY
jgi:archaellum biogenesis ATPase FlaH